MAGGGADELTFDGSGMFAKKRRTLQGQTRQLNYGMEPEYLPEFEGTYLEDSYFLGAQAEGRNLRLKMLFALTIDHADYAPPKPGEQHCYREGSILIDRPIIIEWHVGKPTILRDADGTIDFGSLEFFRHAPNRFRVVTEWFDTSLETFQVSVQLT